MMKSAFIRKALLTLSICLLGGLHAVEIGAIKVQSTSKDMKQDALEQLVAGAVASRPGSQMSPATVSEDIQKLIKTGKLDDVRVSTASTADGKVELTFILTPKPIVTNIYIKGNSYYKSEKLKKHISHEVGVQVDEKQLAADRKALFDKYMNAGYHGTEITTVKSANPSGSGIDITFVVKEEARYKLKKVYFENNTAYDESTLRSSIATQRQWWRYIFRLGNYYNKSLVPIDKDKLKKLYGQKGYLDFTVKDVRIDHVDDLWITVTFVLDEGQPYTVGDITLSGAKRFPNDEVLAKATTKKGDVHDTDREELDINLMRAEYERLGYLDLRLFPNYKKHSDTHVVDVAYTLIEGSPSTIRNIEISGNTVTQDQVIRRELTIAPGDLGDMGKVRTSKQRLSNLGYFESVEILPIVTDSPELRDLRIQLQEKPTGQLSVGAGFSSEDSAIGFVEFSETNFDLARLMGMEWPPKGAGQRLRTRVQVGSDSSNATITHTEPWFLDRRLELTTELFIRNRYEDEYDQRNIGGGMMLSWPVAFRVPFTDHIENNWRMGVGFRVEQVKISDVDTHDPDKAKEDGDFVKDHILADEEDSYTVSRLIWRMTRDTRNSFLFPTRGSKITLQTELVTEALGAYETYARFELGGTKYLPVYSDFVLKMAANYYSTTGDDAAIFDRYFGGGIGTIRGFKRRDVAPVDCYEDPLGGNSMVTGTLELIKPVRDFMFVSTFLDAGNAWWDDFEMDLGDLNYSIGVGVQFKALPISIYYGYPISTSWDHLDGKSGRVHFNIGLAY